MRCAALSIMVMTKRRRKARKGCWRTSRASSPGGLQAVSDYTRIRGLSQRWPMQLRGSDSQPGDLDHRGHAGQEVGGLDRLGHMLLVARKKGFQSIIRPCERREGNCR